MRHFALTLVALFTMSLSTFGQRILGYYPYYVANEEDNIQYDKLTDIVYAFLQLDGEGNLTSGNYFLPTQFAKVRDNAQAVGVKVHVSVGGGGQPSNDLAWIAADVDKRATMVQDIRNFVAGNHSLNNKRIDGIDVDWEYPTDATKRAQHEALLSELRAAMDAQGAIDGVHYEVSIAIGGDVLSPTSHADYINDGAFQYCDLVSIMSYDLGYMSQYGGDHASYQAVIDGIDHYMNEKGLKAEQVMVGVPFYGRQSGGWTAQNYDDINSGNGSQAIFEGSSSGGYLYDGKTELDQKVDYVVGTIGGAGITIWELTADRHDQYSLLTALADKMDEYGCSAPQPDLGSEVSICGASSLTLNSGLTSASGRSFAWTRNSQAISGNGPTLAVSQSGTYEVTVSEDGCSKSDQVVVSGNLPSPDLGEPVDLCSPAVVTLDAGVSGNGLVFSWEKNGETISGENSAALLVSEEATYTVNVSATGCGSASDAVVVSSSLPSVEVLSACTDQEANIQSSESVDWFSSPTSDQVLFTGTNYAPTLTDDATFYVEATGGATAALVGKSSLSGGWYANSQVYAHKFVVSQALTIESLDLNMERAGNVTVNVLGSDGSTQLLSSGAISASAGEQTVQIDFVLEPGTYYLTTKGTSQNLYVDPAESASPFEISGVISIEGTAYEDWSNNGYTVSQNYGQTYNWKIISGSACERVAVNVDVTVSPDAPASFIQSTSQVAPGDVGVVYEVPEEAGISYAWSYSGGGVTISGSGNEVLLDFSGNATSGELSVTAQSSSCGSSDALTLNVTVQNPLSVVDGAESSRTWSLYPNPTLDHVMLNLVEVEGLKRISLMDATGHVIQELESALGQMELEVSLENHPAGLYLIQVVSEAGREMLPVYKK